MDTLVVEPQPLTDDLPPEEEARTYSLFSAARVDEITRTSVVSPKETNGSRAAYWQLSEVIRLSPRIQLGGYWRGLEGWNVLLRAQGNPRLVIARVGETILSLRVRLEELTPCSSENRRASAVLRDEESGRRLILGSGEEGDDSLLAIVTVNDAGADELPVATDESFFVGEEEFRVTRIEENPARVWAVRIAATDDSEPESVEPGQFFESNGPSH